jgi:hypothetical protein
VALSRPNCQGLKLRRDPPFALKCLTRQDFRQGFASITFSDTLSPIVGGVEFKEWGPVGKCPKDGSALVCRAGLFVPDKAMSMLRDDFAEMGKS